MQFDQNHEAHKPGYRHGDDVNRLAIYDAPVPREMSEIIAAVGELYERFPYPSYPLFLSLRWQEISGSSLFSAQLFKAHTGRAHAAVASSHDTKGVLLAGCGEALPYIIRHIEPACFGVSCVDISRRSLRRARIRLLTNYKPTTFFAADINAFLKGGQDVYHHIDSYGVLHHLENPSLSVKLLAQHLHGNGTCRFMVYNQKARDWLIHIQKAFALLKLERYNERDRELGKALLKALCAVAPALHDKVSGMGPVTFANDARFVDTFFHAWEIRYDLKRWSDISNTRA